MTPTVFHARIPPTRNCLPLLLGVGLLAACGSLPDRHGAHHRDSAPSHKVEIARIPNAVPRLEPRSKYGNPESYVVNNKRYFVMKDSRNYRERGIASWYGTKFHGRKTSTGEPYDMLAMTAAHKTLPLPTYVEVTNLDNGRKVIVRVNDRGPFMDNRIIDLSYVAAAKLDLIKHGTGRVEVRAIDPTAHLEKQLDARASTAPAPTQAAPAAEHFYLQIGAFSERRNAESLRARLERLSPGRIHVKEAASAANPLYQVHIGPFYNRHEAARMTRELAAMGLGEPHTITYRNDRKPAARAGVNVSPPAPVLR